jgi:hypothetical protein
MFVPKVYVPCFAKVSDREFWGHRVGKVHAPLLFVDRREHGLQSLARGYTSTDGCGENVPRHCCPVRSDGVTRLGASPDLGVKKFRKYFTQPRAIGNQKATVVGQVDRRGLEEISTGKGFGSHKHGRREGNEENYIIPKPQ